METAMTSHQMPDQTVDMKADDMSGAPRKAGDGAGHAANLQSRSADKRDGSPGVRLLRGDEWRRAERALQLSGREVDISRAIFEDLTEAEIAEELGISPHTVHTHVERLYRKLRVGSRTQLVLCVVQRGIGRA
jgi:DNA-binding NarL/FixJ family response regulator